MLKTTNCEHVIGEYENPCSVARRTATLPTRVDLDIHVMTLDGDGVVRIYARGMPGKPPKLIARLEPETARVFAKIILEGAICLK